MKRKNRGFTLIELLVVLSIISVLTSIVLASISLARSKARNSVRLENINTLQIAYHNSLSGGKAEPSCGVSCNACITQGGCSGRVANANVDTFFAIPYPTDPTDPVRTNYGYRYRSNVDLGAGSGVYLQYFMEPGGSCGRGFDDGNSAPEIECALKLN